MVGRLVEQQHVGLLRQRPGDRRPPPLAARRGRGRRGRGRARSGRRSPPPRAPPARPARPARSRASVAKPRHLRVLLEQHHLGPRLDRPPPLVGLDQVGEAFEQGRLARAVAPDQRQPVALADEQVEPAEQPAGALDEAEIFISEDGRGHGGPDRGESAARHPAPWPADIDARTRAGGVLAGAVSEPGARSPTATRSARPATTTISPSTATRRPRRRLMQAASEPESYKAMSGRAQIRQTILAINLERCCMLLSSQFDLSSK